MFEGEVSGTPVRKGSNFAGRDPAPQVAAAATFINRILACVCYSHKPKNGKTKSCWVPTK